MAFGEQYIAPIPVAYTIHVWPTRQLIAKSWTWSERWHAAYQQMAWALSLAAATQVLDGGRFARRTIAVETEIGRVKFTISQAGTTVHIVVSEFSGPNAPSPDGGEAQPHAIDGLVIGLRSGANGTFHVVVFHGRVPSIPCTNRYSIVTDEPSYSVDRAQIGCPNMSRDEYRYVRNANPIDWARALPRDLRADPTVDAIVACGSSIENIAGIDQIAEAAAARDGVGISRFAWTETDCFEESLQEIYLGVPVPGYIPLTEPVG